MDPPPTDFERVGILKKNIAGAAENYSPGEIAYLLELAAAIRTPAFEARTAELSRLVAVGAAVSRPEAAAASIAGFL